MKITKKHARLMKKAVAVLGGQDKAAPFFGVCQGTISNYCTGKTAVPMEARIKVDAVLEDEA